MFKEFSTSVEPNYQGLIDCLMRKGTPDRVYNMELYLDYEMHMAVAERFSLIDGLDKNDPFFDQKLMVKVQRFLGYDYVRMAFEGLEIDFTNASVQDTAEMGRAGGRVYIDEHTGPITSWQDFEQFPWPDPYKATSKALDWYEENLPEDMCIIGSGGFAHHLEWVTWLMGYENLCYALFEQRDLVRAIADKVSWLFEVALERLLKYDRVKIIWGSDDLGYKSGTMISPDDLREFIFPGHAKMVEMSHKAGRPYLLHACGNLFQVIDDLTDDVKIDAKHSFEDTIESVIDAKQTYGKKIALIGGIDVDFLCRAGESEIRSRVRKTLEACQPGGGYCLGTGNSVTNYIPIDNYLVMLDEGRRFTQ